MSSISDLIDDVLAEAYGYSQIVDTTTYLASSVGATSTTITVSDSSRFSRGLVQIDEELMLVNTVANNSLGLGTTLSRGVRGTTAVAHTAGALVTMAPSIPRHQAATAVMQTIESSSGLFSVGSTTFTFTPAQASYALPSEADTVLNVSYVDVMGDPVRINRYRQDRYNSKIILGEAPVPGRTVTVSYSKEPTWPGTTGEFSATGLPSSCEDVIRFGAAWRISSFLPAQATLMRTAESDAMGQSGYRQSSPLKTSQYLFQIYRQRLDEEVKRLLDRYPTTTHWGA